MNLCLSSALLFESVRVLTEMAMGFSISGKPLSESATALPPGHVVRENTAMALLPISGRHDDQVEMMREVPSSVLTDDEQLANVVEEFAIAIAWSFGWQVKAEEVKQYLVKECEAWRV
jgi:hypothetical protein